MFYNCVSLISFNIRKEEISKQESKDENMKKHNENIN